MITRKTAKWALIIVVFSFTIILFCSCTNENSNTSPENIEAHEALSQVITETENTINIWKSQGEPSGFWTAGKAKNKYITFEDVQPTMYTYKDLDGDNIDELIVSGDITILGIFTYKNNQIFKVAYGWPRQCISICENNLLKINGSGGWATGDITVGKLSLSEQPNENIFGNLSVIEKLTWTNISDKKVKIASTQNETTSEEVIPLTELSSKTNSINDKYIKDGTIQWTYF